MIELRLLGLHGLRGSDGRELGALPAQPKRFALLAYLAIGSGDGYHRRDTVAAMFWPDLDQFAARRALRNTLFHLRAALGDGVIIARGDDAISTDPAALTSDVARLREAVDAGRYEDAVNCYRGVLLEGMHLVKAGEAFEEWLSRERRSIDASLTRALGGLVDREERSGNVAAAARWAERACGLAPDDERWLRRALSLLERAGDTGRALRLYETYAERLAAEFTATPSIETKTLAKRIRDGSGPQPRSEAAQPTQPPPVSPESTPIATPEDNPRVVETPRPEARASAPAPRGRSVAIWIAMAVATSVIGTFAVRSLRAARPRRDAQPRVLVAVFDNRTGDAELSSLGRMTQDWITQGVVRTHLAEVVDPRSVFVQGRSGGADADPIAMARRTGAGTVVSGDYYRSGDTLLFQASVVDVHAGRIMRAVGPIVSSVRTPVAALDELRSRVLSAIASAVDIRATQDLEHGELPTFDAYRDYVDGWDAFWHGDNPRAQALFLRAANRHSLPRRSRPQWSPPTRTIVRSSTRCRTHSIRDHRRWPIAIVWPFKSTMPGAAATTTRCSASRSSVLISNRVMPPLKCRPPPRRRGRTARSGRSSCSAVSTRPPICNGARTRRTGPTGAGSRGRSTCWGDTVRS
jgi:DNA-binding SARP family transcriptional activator/TolB-like protein